MGEDDKSLGNFVLVHDLIEKLDPQVLRFFLASAHYHSRPHLVIGKRLQAISCESWKYKQRSSHRAVLENSRMHYQRMWTLTAKFAAIEQNPKRMDDDFRRAANGS